MVPDSFARILVRKLHLLLFRIPSPSNASKQEPSVKNILGRILVFSWASIAGGVLLLIFIPKPGKLPPWIPNPLSLRVFLVFLMLLSVVYGVGRLYRQGIRLARKK